MDRLDFALVAPAPGRESAWLEGVHAAFRDLAAALTDHVAEVEAADGLFAQVGVDAPRLASLAKGSSLRAAPGVYPQVVRALQLHS